ncbi:MAG TPA: circularly permuted type 2 ATP-grasp protein [Burkholderiales bacterium]|nr:circularly permuted type 2 ATP-grasp protein [Burkholderiales bacterium]
MSFDSYYNEMYLADGSVRGHYRRLAEWIAGTPADHILQMRQAAQLLFHRVGITFAVYGEDAGAERLIPFDMLPHIIPAAEWRDIANGLRQRARALNAFLHDIYHGQEILNAGKVPREQVLENRQYRPEMAGIDLPGGIYAHIAGIDLVRAGAGEYYVLEDNLRTPSGVSYMLENRKMMMRLVPELFARQSIAPVEHYPDMLLENLRSVAPDGVENPTVVVLTPGQFNSAYFEHAFLAQQMGIELVEGADLFMRDDSVFMRTTAGPQRVDVIYRRIDDDFIDPQAFRPDSTLGVPGLVNAYRKGRVTLANAIGTGVADDKSIYPYVPEMIRFYLGEEPLLNNVPTYQLRLEKDLAYVLDHLAKLVVKEVHGSGGYGMLIGPASTEREREAYRQRILDAPEKFIAQPTLSLSTCPIFVEQGIAPRHIDLRPFVLSGKHVMMVPGGLTRVALREGSLVVNSSQGGGTKDTWIVEN